jgi:hypothetical protein
MKQAELNVISTITEGMQIGLKNVASLIIAAILYVFTIWIPYINVGTTIAMMTIPGRLAKGEVISPLFIFGSEYRKDFSAFFLLMAFINMVVFVGFCFMVIPAIVISLSMSLAVYILVDFDKSPTDAMKLSNQATTGHKWTMFFIEILFYIVIAILGAIIKSIADVLGDTLGMILIALYIASIIPFKLGINSVIYRTLFLETYEEVAATAEPKVGVSEVEE